MRLAAGLGGLYGWVRASFGLLPGLAVGGRVGLGWGLEWGPQSLGWVRVCGPQGSGADL